MTKPPRVAVVAVHGVGHHEPGASAHAIARLLLRTPRGEAARYTSFSEHDISVPTRRVAEDLQPPAPTPGPRPSLKERPVEDTAAIPAPLDVEFMRGQLKDYSPENEDGVYETVRLEGHRIEGSGPTRLETDVHIYEVFWSDISQIGKSVFGIFGAFYQVVIHLPYVGAWTLQQVPQELRVWPTWRAMRALYSGAQRSLTLLAPTLNIVLLALATTLFMQHLPPGARPWAVRIIAGLMMLGLTLWAMVRLGGKRRGWQILIPLALAVTVGTFLPRLFPQHTEWLLVAEWWLLVAVPLYVVLSAFEKNRPLALPLGAMLYIASTVLLVIYSGSGSADDTGTAVLHSMEWLARAIQWTWFLFGFCLLGVIVLGAILPELTGTERPRARRAAYTARFTLTIPAIAFSAATLLVWGGLVAAESTTVFSQTKTYKPVLQYPALVAHQRYAATGIDSLQGIGAISPDSATALRRVLESPGYFLRAFWGSADTSFGVFGAILFVLILLIVVVVLVPIVSTELRSPPSALRDANDPRFEKASLRLGLWLSFAFRASRIGGELMGAVCLMFFIALFAVEPMLHRLIPESWSLFAIGDDRGLGFSFRNYGGWLASGAGTLGALALLGRLSRAGLGLRPVLGVAVDVDNYLRELPRARTPRARMAERYTSMLRYLCAWRAVPDDPDSGYDRVVIISHSQGTVITVDLLRYLQYERSTQPGFEPGLDRLGNGGANSLPISLLTMGSPLRQLYALRFPNLYSWVGFDDPSGPVMGNILGVSSWMNAYRSGDYVGRGIWRDDDQAAATFKPFVKFTAQSASEVCIGPGAHTHYWDESADSIAAYVDEAITRSGRGGVRSGPSPVSGPATSPTPI